MRLAAALSLLVLVPMPGLDAAQPPLESDVLAYVQHGDSNVREGLAEVLGYIGDAHVVPARRELSRDEHPQVAALAAQALQRVEARSRS